MRRCPVAHNVVLPLLVGVECLLGDIPGEVNGGGNIALVRLVCVQSGDVLGVFCKLRLLRSHALCDSLVGVRRCPVAHNVVLPLLVSGELLLGHMVGACSLKGRNFAVLLRVLGVETRNGFCVLLRVDEFKVLHLVVNGGNGSFKVGVLGFEVCDVLRVAVGLSFQSSDTALMVGQLISVPGQLLRVGGDKLPVCQLCRFGAVRLSGEGGVGGVGLGIECIKTPFGGGGAFFESVKPPVLLNVLLLNVGDCVRVLGDFGLIFGEVGPESVGDRGKPFDSRMVIGNFLMQNGKLCGVVFELCGVLRQLLGINGNVCRVVLNVRGIPGDVLRVLGDSSGLCIVDSLDCVQPCVLLPVLRLNGRNVRVIGSNLPLKVSVLRFECGNVLHRLSLPGLKVRDSRVGVVHALCQSVHPGDGGRHGVLHLRVVLVILGDFVPEFLVIRCKPRNLFGQVFHLIFVLFDLCIICTGQRPVAFILDVDTGRHGTLGSIGLALIGDDSQGLISPLSVPFDGVSELRDVPRPDVHRRPAPRGRGRRRTRRARGTAGVRTAGMTLTARCERCRLDGERMTILFVCHIDKAPSLVILDNEMTILRFGDVCTGIKGKPLPVSGDISAEAPGVGQPKPHKMHHFIHHCRKVFVCPLNEPPVLKVPAVETVVDTVLCIGQGFCSLIQSGDITAVRVQPFRKLFHERL